MARTLLVLAALVGLLIGGTAMAGTSAEEPKDVHWSFEGPFGHYDQAQLQRGYKVYHEVCSSCHSMNLVAFRNLGDPGGPFWDPKFPNSNNNPYVKAIIADFKVSDVDHDTGDVIKRPATTADHFVPPFANEYAARASNGGAYPPDMSLLVKAREGGAAYVYSIISGFPAAPPAGLTVPPGKYYNPYMPGDLSSFWHGTGPVPVGGFISMPPPLAAGRVTFDDKTPSTLDQQAKDVAAFLTWAGDPKMEERKSTGFPVMIFLLIFAGVVYASYRTIWRKVQH